MITHSEYGKMRAQWKPITPREEELSQAFEDLFIADAERAGAGDWACQYNVKFADRVRLMDEFTDIPSRRFNDIWNYEAIFWKYI
jgi:hypothetical protein